MPYNILYQATSISTDVRCFLHILRRMCIKKLLRGKMVKNLMYNNEGGGFYFRHHGLILIPLTFHKYICSIIQMCIEAN